MRLIDADNLKKDLNVEFIFDSRDRYRVRDLIDFQLTIEAEPVRYGKWVKENVTLTSDPPQYQWHCSECGRLTHWWFSREVLTKYCPNCGAKMDGGEE